MSCYQFQSISLCQVISQLHTNLTLHSEVTVVSSSLHYVQYLGMVLAQRLTAARQGYSLSKNSWPFCTSTCTLLMYCSVANITTRREELKVELEGTARYAGFTSTNYSYQLLHLYISASKALLDILLHSRCGGALGVRASDVPADLGGGEGMTLSQRYRNQLICVPVKFKYMY